MLSTAKLIQENIYLNHAIKKNNSISFSRLQGYLAFRFSSLVVRREQIKAFSFVSWLRIQKIKNKWERVLTRIDSNKGLLKRGFFLRS